MSNIIVCNSEYTDKNSVYDVLHYIVKPKQINTYIDWYGLGVLESSIQNASDSFLAIKKIYGKEDGKQLHHFVISPYTGFPMNIAIIHLIGFQILQYVYDIGFQGVIAYHGNTFTPHIHIVINSISYKDGSRLNNIKAFYNKLLYFLKYYYGNLKWEDGVIYK